MVEAIYHIQLAVPDSTPGWQLTHLGLSDFISDATHTALSTAAGQYPKKGRLDESRQSAMATASLGLAASLP